MQHQQLRLRLHLELLRDPEQLRQQPGDGDLFERPLEQRLADRAAGLGERFDRFAGRHEAGVEMHLRHFPVIAGEKAQQHIGQIVAMLAVEPPHDAEIDRSDGAVGQDEEIARVQIGVKEAVAEHHGEERGRRLANEIARLDAGGENALLVVDRQAADAFGGQHAPAGARPVDARHPEVFVAGEVLGQLRRRRRFEPQIHLELDRFMQAADDLDRMHPLPVRPPPLDQLGHPEQKIEVAGEGFRDAGPQHDDRLHGFAPMVVGHADHRGVDH